MAAKKENHEDLMLSESHKTNTVRFHVDEASRIVRVRDSVEWWLRTKTGVRTKTGTYLILGD